jgi:hypothetical protein
MKMERSAENQKHVFKTFFRKLDLDIFILSNFLFFLFFFFFKRQSIPVPNSDKWAPPGSFLFPFLELFGNKKERHQLSEQRARRRASKRLTGQAEGLEPKTGVSRGGRLGRSKRANGVLRRRF